MSEVAAEVSTKAVPPTPIPVRLNVGCGHDIREGWLNVDSGDWHKPDMVADITDLPMLPNRHFLEIVAQDVLEHIPRTKQVSTMIEWGRLLAPSGVLRVRVPSLYDMANLVRHPEWQSEERQQYLVQMAYGTQAYPGDFHLCGYTPWTVTGNAKEAGLIVSRASVRDFWLYELEFRLSSEIYSLSDEEWLHHVYFSKGHRCIDLGGLEHWGRELANGHKRREIEPIIVAALLSEQP
ncbi:hypothetical protein U8607_09940 [Methylobacterium durans]|uniref:class I SAM-dependent methyltransferase n=1 Tax=Methylobacterium durans TaxID=2202825 RepID=UPI002AFE1C53|nr:hypothetical protein [Methylobacterium durans]MEA1832406.1 hypothetical protein [Methylobacterium durans]